MSMRARRTFEFFPPDIIEFDYNIRNGVILIYHSCHDTPATIYPDYYLSIFKPLCLAYSKRWISEIRSKYESITTPSGDVRLNWQKLDTEATTELEQLFTKLDNLPPDKLVDFGEW